MMEFEPYRLDVVNQCLWRSSQTASLERVELTPKTFKVLHYLLQHAGRLVTHDELLDSVWFGVHVQQEVLKGHILAIRTALGDSAQNPRFIETVRGRGYRFIATINRVGTAKANRLAPLNHGGFVGRADQLRELEGALCDTESDRQQLMFIVGEAGAGKTALLDQFLARCASTPHILVARSSCIEGYGGSEPYYPVLEALSQLCKGPDGEDVVQGLLTLAPSWAVQLPAYISTEQYTRLKNQIAGAGGTGYMLHEICSLLEALSIDRPLLLVFEDLHWGDYSTVDLIAAIARRRGMTRLMVIATYRPEDDESGQHPVKQLSQELLLRQLCRKITLGPLSENAVGELLAGKGVLRPQEQEFARLITEHSDGNPLFVQAILVYLVEHGVVEKTEQGWRKKAQPSKIAFEIPRTIVQVIEARIQRLSTDQQRLLEAASVAGLEFSSATVAEAAGFSADNFDDVCEMLARRRCFISRAKAGISASGQLTQRFRFDHTMFRCVFYDRQPLARRAYLHHTIGTRLEALCDSDQLNEFALELGQHFAVARDWPKALEYLRVALHTAQKRFAYRESLAILDLADKLAVNLPDEQRSMTSLDLLEWRASLYAAGYDPRAEQSYALLVKEAERFGLVDLQAQALLGLALTVSWRAQDESFEIVEIALKVSQAQTNLQSRAMTRMSCYQRRLWVRGWSSADIQDCDVALSALRAGDDALKTAWGLIEYSVICLMSSRYREGRESIQANYLTIFENVDARRRFDVARGSWMIRLGMTWTSLFLGEFGKSFEEFKFGIEMFRKNGNYYASRKLKIFSLTLSFFARDFDAVIETCKQLNAQQDMPDTDEDGARDGLLPDERRMCVVLSGLAYMELGNQAMALACLVEADQAMDVRPITFDWYWRLAVAWGLVGVALMRGDEVEANQCAQRFIQLAQQTDEHTWHALAWEAMARVRLFQGDAANAKACIHEAREASVGYETPLADWRINCTAASIHELAGEPELATVHRRLGIEMQQELANSLPKGHRLRLAFERSERVNDVMKPESVDLLSV